MRFYNYKTDRGFSLVETLVAVSIVLIVIVGPMTLSSKTAKSSTFATEQIQAYFLAQEGLELAQKARDQYLLEYFENPVAMPDPWSSFDDDYTTCSEANGCGLVWGGTDGVLATPVSCSSDNCKLYLSSSGRSRYTHTSAGNENTPFTRKIYFSTTASNREIYVRSEVTWRTGSLIAKQSVVAETYLFNIYALP